MNKFSAIVCFFFVFLANRAFSCQCPLSNLSLDECGKYELIFRGKIKSSSGCTDKKGEAVFEVLELYKGNTPMSFNVVYDCGVECAQTFNPGEEWIIYTNYRQVNNAKMDWCSRSRKHFNNDKEDYYMVTYGNSYDDELEFLRKNLGLHRLLKNNPGATTTERNIRPSNAQMIIMVLVSIGAVLLFYYLFNKFFR